MKKTIFATMVVALVASGTLYGQRPDHPGPRSNHHWQEFLNKHDTDGNGEVSEAEFDASKPFERLDTNGDGVVTQDDFRQRSESRMITRVTSRLIVRADEDQDGEVTSGDFNAFLSELDEDGNGELNRQELIALRAEAPGGGHHGSQSRGQRSDRTFTVVELEAAFTALDENGDGVVLREELPQMRHRGPRGHHQRGGRGGHGQHGGQGGQGGNGGRGGNGGGF